MRRIILIAMIAFATNAKSQDEKCFTKGTSAFNIGAGILQNLGVGYVTDHFFYDPYIGTKPILTGSYEYGIVKVGKGIIGAGLSVNYSSCHTVTDASFAGGGSYKNNETDIVVGLRAAYHPDFCTGKKYDVYGAVQLNIYGYAFSRISNAPEISSYNSRNIQRILPSLLIGVRYYPIKNIGLFAELGYDYAIIKCGVSLKFSGKIKGL